MFNLIGLPNVKNVFRQRTTGTIANLSIANIILECLSVVMLAVIFALYEPRFDDEVVAAIAIVSVILIIALVFAIINCAGWKKIYNSSNSPYENANPQSGMTMVQVVSITVTVLLAIFMILFLIGSISELSKTSRYDSYYDYYGYYGNYYGSSSNDKDSTILMLLVYVPLITIMFLQSLFEAIFMAKAKKSAYTPNLIPSGKAYGVFSIIVSVFNFISATGTLILGIYYISKISDAYSFAGTFGYRASSSESVLLILLILMFVIGFITTILSGITLCLKAKLAFSYSRESTPMFTGNAPYNTYQNTAPIQGYSAPVNQNYPVKPYNTNYNADVPPVVNFDPNTGRPVTPPVANFDPNTGKPIAPPVANFDPNTGKPIAPSVANSDTNTDKSVEPLVAKFDPNTGKPIEPLVAKFDPDTGLPLNQQNDNPINTAPAPAEVDTNETATRMYFEDEIADMESDLEATTLLDDVNPYADTEN